MCFGSRTAIQELYLAQDALMLMQQLGVIPAPGQH